MSEPETKPLQVDLSSIIPRITEQVAAELRQKAVQKFEWQVTEAVAGEVKRYITENIIPHITKELEAQDVNIRAAVVTGVATAAEALRDKIIKISTDKITGYEGDKIVMEFVSKVLGRGY